MCASMTAMDSSTGRSRAYDDMKSLNVRKPSSFSSAQAGTQSSVHGHIVCPWPSSAGTSAPVLRPPRHASGHPPALTGVHQHRVPDLLLDALHLAVLVHADEAVVVEVCGHGTKPRCVRNVCKTSPCHSAAHGCTPAPHTQELEDDQGLGQLGRGHGKLVQEPAGAQRHGTRVAVKRRHTGTPRSLRKHPPGQRAPAHVGALELRVDEAGLGERAHLQRW